MHIGITRKTAELTTNRKSPHDIGSVDGIVKQYLKQKSALGTAARLTKTTPFKGKPGRK